MVLPKGTRKSLSLIRDIWRETFGHPQRDLSQLVAEVYPLLYRNASADSASAKDYFTYLRADLVPARQRGGGRSPGEGLGSVAGGIGTPGSGDATSTDTIDQRDVAETTNKLSLDPLLSKLSAPQIKVVILATIDAMAEMRSAQVAEMIISELVEFLQDRDEEIRRRYVPRACSTCPRRMAHI